MIVYYDIKENHQQYYCKYRCHLCDTKFKVKGEYKDLIHFCGLEDGISAIRCPSCHVFSVTKLSKLKKLKK